MMRQVTTGGNMCLSTVYLDSGDKQIEFMKDVATIEPCDNGFWLINLFGEKTLIKGKIKAVNLLDGHFVMMENG